jgi:hypothetical protein
MAPLERVSALLQAVPARPAPNPRDVAALFDWLDIGDLRYWEFQLPDEVATPDLRPKNTSPKRKSAPAAIGPVLLQRSSVR